MTSFSALTREKNPHAGTDGIGHPAEISAVRIPSDQMDSAEGSDPARSNAFFSAPGGPVMGTAIHDWIEEWDFLPLDLLALELHLKRYPLPDAVPPLHGQVAGMLEALGEACLPGLDCRVREACPQAAASEWHFQLPIHSALSSSTLAEVFSAHGQPDYAALLRDLPVEELQGYLHGFLDRIAVYQGTWGVIDWKTNLLGTTRTAYERPVLREAAMRSHYWLQAHLYLVALRRYLGPDVPIAGAWLIFLRGVRPGTSDGVLPIEPTPALMAALDGLFARPGS
jgi:exodeoxyribonuclease V beta subunit